MSYPQEARSISPRTDICRTASSGVDCGDVEVEKQVGNKGRVFAVGR